MFNQRRKWKPPQIMALGALPEGLGHCQSGSTQTGDACANGQNTGQGAGHKCTTGTIAGNNKCAQGGTETN